MILHWAIPSSKVRSWLTPEHSVTQTPRRWVTRGENIVCRGPYDDKPDGWRQAAKDLFEDWRNSKSYNANMLSAGFQGMGLSLVRTADGEVRGPTMFFAGELPVRVGGRGNAYIAPDETTNRAEASGVPFYIPAGARERLGVRSMSNPADVKGYSVTNTVMLPDGLGVEVIPGFTVLESSGTRPLTLDRSKNAARARSRGDRDTGDCGVDDREDPRHVHHPIRPGDADEDDVEKDVADNVHSLERARVKRWWVEHNWDCHWCTAGVGCSCRRRGCCDADGDRLIGINRQLGTVFISEKLKRPVELNKRRCNAKFT